MIDVVTVVYNQKTVEQAELLYATLRVDPAIAQLIEIDNRTDNRGFSKACNEGARTTTADVIGFINPDAVVVGPLDEVELCFASNPKVMVTGCSFDKSPALVAAWGCQRWVCGAAFFVRRSWFEQLGGFDEQFVFGYEETDFCRRTELAGFQVLPIPLPIRHDSPGDDPIETEVYKVFHMNRGWARYRAKHGIMV